MNYGRVPLTVRFHLSLSEALKPDDFNLFFMLMERAWVAVLLAVVEL